MGKEADFAHQRKPHGVGEPVIEQVRDDLYKRSLFGIEKYGEALKAFNGRDSLKDAYEEILDLAVYLKQKINEQDLLVLKKYRVISDGKIFTLLMETDGGRIVVVMDEDGATCTFDSVAFYKLTEELANDA